MGIWNLPANAEEKKELIKAYRKLVRTYREIHHYLGDDMLLDYSQDYLERFAELYRIPTEVNYPDGKRLTEEELDKLV